MFLFVNFLYGSGWKALVAIAKRRMFCGLLIQQTYTWTLNSPKISELNELKRALSVLDSGEEGNWFLPLKSCHSEELMMVKVVRKTWPHMKDIKQILQLGWDCPNQTPYLLSTYCICARDEEWENQVLQLNLGRWWPAVENFGFRPEDVSENPVDNFANYWQTLWPLRKKFF